jgi:cytochrome oxidase Cu insertion factor (SCO1/SenC/PrrC family)
MSDTTQLDPMIQMSVHSLPQAAQASTAVAQRTRIGRLKMLLVWAVCAAPVVASYLSYYVIKPQGRVNYGTLILPPKGMPLDGSLGLADLQGLAVQPSSLKGQWLLVTVANAACDARCEQHLYLQRQLREVLGKDKDRLDRVWLIPDQAAPRSALLPGLKGAWVLHTDPTALPRWLTPEPGQPLDAHLYLVDPRGDWMMRFPANADPARIKKDLVRLMKANESWDEPGR